MNETPVATLWAAPSSSGRWFGFFSYVSDIWCRDKTKARQVDLYEDPEGDYYGWVDFAENKVRMVQPSLIQWEMQSPDFFKHAIETGRGRQIRLRAVPREPGEG